MSALLEITALLVERDAGTLLDVPTLTVEAGQVAAVNGPTDAGKSLLAAVLCGRVEPSGGTIRVAGRPLSGGPVARRRAGLAATVADGGRIAGCTVEEALRLAGRRRAVEALDRFPLLSLRRRVRADLLSGGEHQLLEVACAWCADPRVLVLDAPTAGLAADVADSVVALAAETAAAGAAVLWLDQSGAPSPVAARWLIAGGALSAVTAAESPPGPGESNSP